MSRIKYWARKRWTWIRDNWDDTIPDGENYKKLYKAIPELKKFDSGCSYCNLFSCHTCPLKDSGYVCFKEYYEWTKNKIAENAQLMIDKIERDG